jgi:predicted nucleic acid-binding protein
MIIVSNITPLIGLASIQRFDLLHQLLGQVYIAQAVYDEAVVGGIIVCRPARGRAIASARLQSQSSCC